MNLTMMYISVTVQQVTNGTQPFVIVSHEEISIATLISKASKFASGTETPASSFHATVSPRSNTMNWCRIMRVKNVNPKMRSLSLVNAQEATFGPMPSAIASRT